MIDFEVEQKFCRDVAWLKKTKEVLLERQAINEKYLAEKKEREEQRKKY
jgi:hypothetical protein